MLVPLPFLRALYLWKWPQCNFISQLRIESQMKTKCVLFGRYSRHQEASGTGRKHGLAQIHKSLGNSVDVRHHIAMIATLPSPIASRIVGNQNSCQQTACGKSANTANSDSWHRFQVTIWPTQPMLAGSSHTHTYGSEKARAYQESH